MGASNISRFKEIPFLKAKRHRAHSVTSGVRVKASKPKKNDPALRDYKRSTPSEGVSLENTLEVFPVDSFFPTVRLAGRFYDGVLGNVFSSDEAFNWFATILEDHLHSVLRTQFPGKCTVFQNNTDYVHASLCVEISLHEADDEMDHLMWCH
ncbi:hypothetical protein TNCV_1663761 [Trichonephila clavipes]|nr:hypothetical protein TNCV_1663761 [Trichonephila clavipes]